MKQLAQDERRVTLLRFPNFIMVYFLPLQIVIASRAKTAFSINFIFFRTLNALLGVK